MRPVSHVVDSQEAPRDIIRPWFAQRTMAEAKTALDAGGVLWGPYQTMRGFAEKFQADPTSAPVLVDLDQPGIGTVISSSAPIRVDEQYTGAAPAHVLGADTDEVLASVLGLSDAELGKLHDAGTI